MIRAHVLALGILSAITLAGGAVAKEPAVPDSPARAALREKLSELPADGSDVERQERAALAAFYEARGTAPLWIEGKGLTPKAAAAIAEIENAGAWGLDASGFSLPELSAASDSAGELAPDTIAGTEIKLSLAVLKYARYARGGRIMDPAGELTSHIDRKPKLIDPRIVLDGIANTEAADAYLRGLHPRHPQFERLRQTYLAVRGGPKAAAKLADGGPDLAPGTTHADVAALRRRLGVRTDTPAAGSGDDTVYDEALREAVIAFQKDNGLAPADGVVGAATRAALGKAGGIDPKKLLANMEQWRWMWEDMGDLYLLANVPEFMLRVVKGGAVIHAERIVAGETGKQTSIFSRPLKSIVFRPMWRVPESIKVRELWPSLVRGGGLMRQHGLEVETKDGQPRDWRAIDWTKADIRDYEVVQPPGRKSVLGVVKFTFPSQHTIYMHDTPDKWMFNSSQRTLSHGCLRLRNPLRVAEIVLAEDKGWSAERVGELAKGGPLNNEVVIGREVPMHITYFTAWVDDGGKVLSFPDVYGHEKRIRLALEGRWNEIVKGRDHLAPVEPVPVAAIPEQAAEPKPKEPAFLDPLSAVIAGGF